MGDEIDDGIFFPLRYEGTARRYLLQCCLLFLYGL
jgi:hypothetical protein